MRGILIIHHMNILRLLKHLKACFVHDSFLCKDYLQYFMQKAKFLNQSILVRWDHGTPTEQNLKILEMKSNRNSLVQSGWPTHQSQDACLLTAPSFHLRAVGYSIINDFLSQVIVKCCCNIEGTVCKSSGSQQGQVISPGSRLPHSSPAVLSV